MWRLRPTWLAAEPRADQQLRGSEGAAGDDRRPAGADRVGAARAVSVAGQALDPDGAPVLDQQPPRLDPGADPGSGGDRAGR